MSVLVRPESKVARVVRRPPDSVARKSDHQRRDSTRASRFVPLGRCSGCPLKFSQGESRNSCLSTAPRAFWAHVRGRRSCCAETQLLLSAAIHRIEWTPPDLQPGLACSGPRITTADVCPATLGRLTHHSTPQRSARLGRGGRGRNWRCNGERLGLHLPIVAAGPSAFNLA